MFCTSAHVFMYVIYRIVIHGLCFTESTLQSGAATPDAFLRSDLQLYLRRLPLTSRKILTEILEKSTPKPKNYHWKPNVGPKESTSLALHCDPLAAEFLGKWLNSFAWKRWRLAVEPQKLRIPSHRIVKQQCNNNKLLDFSSLDALGGGRWPSIHTPKHPHAKGKGGGVRVFTYRFTYLTLLHTHSSITVFFSLASFPIHVLPQLNHR